MSESNSVLEIRNLVDANALATDIVNMFDQWHDDRQQWVDEKKELRNYLFATDTTKTTNATLPWKNTTTTPKLTQIRDNLHANYLSALFSNENWLQWEAFSREDSVKEKRDTITAYMANKARQGGLRETISRLLYDYIDYGNAFAQVVFVNESKTDPVTEETIPGYIGPKLLRISPLDVVFNPLAVDFEHSPKITRTVKTLGEVYADMLSLPEFKETGEYIKDKMQTVRHQVQNYTSTDVDKALGYAIDGFGSISEYFQSPYVEILTFEGDMHDKETDTLLKDHKIVVIDRSYIALKKPSPSWLGRGTKLHAGWRLRPDNLYAMGPLDNLVGMQYRIDHLENVKADLYDLIAHPPLKIKGNVEDFVWEPFAEIFCGDGPEDDVSVLKVDTTGLTADSQIELLMRRMEEMAGAPKEAMGIRTPGEKTAFEVGQLQNAAGRIFQEKITSFEIQLLEPALNLMLETARRNLDYVDTIRVMDDDLGVQKFLDITKEDITASGKLRPVGARHFAAKAQMMQNLTGLAGTGLMQDPAVSAHISGKRIAFAIEELLDLGKFEIVQDNVRVMEMAETEKLKQEAMSQIQSNLLTDVEGGEEAPDEAEIDSAILNGEVDA